MAAAKKTARVVDARMLSPSVRSLSFELTEGALAFAAGQWLDLYVDTRTGLEKRAYSIASAPGQRQFELAITLVPDGVASPALHALVPGAEVLVDGPYGFFTRDGALEHESALFVATGTGLSPLRSMLYAWQKQARRPPITLLFGVRRQADILWHAELTQWARDFPEFSLEVTLSRPDLGWTGRTGHVQNHVAELCASLGAPHVFICGLNRMVSEVRSLCKSALGLDRKRIHSERYD